MIKGIIKYWKEPLIVKMGHIILFLFFSYLIWGAGYMVIAPYVSKDTVTFTVIDKENVVNNNSSKYLIYTKDSKDKLEVFQNTDNWFAFKVNSSDIYGQIDIGKTYEATVYGKRIRMNSFYRNILNISEVKDTDVSEQDK